jgi:hypothetical protein
MEQKRISEIVIFIVALGIGRLVMTFMPNFNPIGAMALFGGAVLASKRLAFLIPLGALFIGDLVLAGIRPGHMDYLLMKNDPSVLFVYGAFALTVWLGYTYLSKGRTTSKVIGTALVSGVLFFLLTNLGAWLTPFYPNTAAGLLASYTAGLAFYNDNALQNFFLNGVVSTVAFSALAFYAYELSGKVFKTENVTPAK